MTQRRLWLAVLVASLVAPAGVFAQTKGGIEQPEDSGIGTAEDPNIPDEPEGDDDDATADEPGDADAVTVGDLEGTTKKKAPRITKKTYPLAVIDRPVTLAAAQTEVSLDVPITLGVQDVGGNDLASAMMTQVIRGTYGITQDLQVGIAYGVGRELLGKESGIMGFEAGKAFSLDGGYTVIPGMLAGTAGLAFFAGDPFAMSLALGAPFRVSLGKKLAVIGGQDLLTFKLVKMPVSVSDPNQNITTAADIAINGSAPNVLLNVTFGALIQAKPNVALTGLIGFLSTFEGERQPVSLTFGVTWSQSPKLDFSARAGLRSLDRDIDQSFGMGLFVAYRL